MVRGNIPGSDNWAKNYMQLPENIRLVSPWDELSYWLSNAKCPALKPSALKQQNWPSQCITVNGTQDLAHAKLSAPAGDGLKLVMCLLKCWNYRQKHVYHLCRGLGEWHSIFPKILKRVSPVVEFWKPISVIHCHFSLESAIFWGPTQHFPVECKRDVHDKGQLLLPNCHWKKWIKSNIAFLELA